MDKSLTFNIDFDGTCVTHEYPEVGKNIGAESVLKELTDKGHRLILFTMRSNEQLQDAVDWFKLNNIPLWSIGYNPEQSEWTDSLKPYADFMIDDSALGTPLTKRSLQFTQEDFFEKYGYSPFLSPKQLNSYCYYDVKRPYVDWTQIKLLLEKLNIL